MKKRMRGFPIVLTFAIFLTVISAGITYKMIYTGSRNEGKMEQIPLETNVVGAKSAGQINNMELEKVLEDVKDLFLESYYGPKDIVELDGEEAKEIADTLKGLELKKIHASREDELYAYILHIKNKNAKIKIGIPYVFVEDVSGNRVAFEGDEKAIENLRGDLEELYMNKYHQSDLFANAEAVIVEAEDEGYRWDVDKKEIETLISNIRLLTPIDGTEVVGILEKYPDYNIVIKTNQQEYRIELINEELLAVDAQNQLAYYQYDGHLWDYITKKYPVKLKAESSDLKSLLKASKIIVDDVEDQYDLEDDSYYQGVIARTILRAKINEIADMDGQQSQVFTLTFTINGKNKVVYVYKDYLAFQGRYYYSPRIDEAIRSTISAP